MNVAGGGVDFAVAKCPHCHMQVPAVNFCALCGEPLATGRGGGWLRSKTFAACPSEGVLRPAPASSLFPHLAQRSRMPFRIGLGLILLGLAVFSTIRITAVVVSIAALGPPLLYLLYLRFSGVRRDLPRGALVVAVLVGAALGVAWARFAARWVPGDYGVPMAAPTVGTSNVAVVVVAVGGAILMVCPVFAARFLRSAKREALDGFVVGVSGALFFVAAATLTRLAVQLQTGFIPHSRPRLNVVVEAGLCGVTIPLTAAATGGVAGLALWLGSGGGRYRHPRRVLILLGFAVLAVYAAIGALDAAGTPQMVMLIIHLVLAFVALQIARTAVQIALLQETAGTGSMDPLLCEHCEHVVPDAPFCLGCGAATRASSKESRRFRRHNRPVPVAVGGRE